MAKDLISFADLVSGFGALDALGSAIRKAAAPSDKFVGKNTFKARILRQLGAREVDPQVMQNMQGLPAGEQSQLRGNGYQGYYIQILEDSPHAFLPDPCPQGDAGTANVGHNQLLQSMYTTALYSGEVLHPGSEVLIRMEKKGFSYDTDIAYIVDVIGSNAARMHREGNPCASGASAYLNRDAYPQSMGKPYGGQIAGENLLKFISKGEGNYNSMNQGTSGNSIVGSGQSSRSDLLGKNLTAMTIAEIMKHQSGEKKPFVFAAGRYQIIPDTMKFVLAQSGISPNTLFNQATQDKLASVLLYSSKRPTLAAYLKGEHDNIETAQIDFAREWASVPDPRTGSSYYGGANKSSHSNAEVQAALRAERQKNMNSADEENLRALGMIS